MKSKINEIFNGNKFSDIDLELGTLYRPENTDEESYWFVVEGNINTILEAQEDFFNMCKENVKLKSFDKNCNLIIITEIDPKEFQTVTINRILQLEEDPYLFRKFVIYYTNDELKELNSIINGQSIYKFISESICDTSLFEKYKENESNFNGYALLYRIMIKLPFVEIHTSENGSLKNLDGIIKNELEAKNLTKDYKNILSFLNKHTISELIDFDPEELFTLFTNQNGGGTNEHQD